MRKIILIGIDSIHPNILCYSGQTVFVMDVLP